MQINNSREDANLFDVYMPHNVQRRYVGNCPGRRTGWLITTISSEDIALSDLKVDPSGTQLEICA
jgi:hypothetical protein